MPGDGETRIGQAGDFGRRLRLARIESSALHEPVQAVEHLLDEVGLRRMAGRLDHLPVIAHGVPGPLDRQRGRILPRNFDLDDLVGNHSGDHAVLLRPGRFRGRARQEIDRRDDRQQRREDDRQSAAHGYSSIGDYSNAIKNL
jgi:hypothetical protein